MTVETKLVTVSIFGCGGCGINIANAIMNTELTFQVDPRAPDAYTNADVPALGSSRIKSAYAIDTCRSNMNDLHASFEQSLLSEEGSGKNRAAHLDTIQHNLAGGEYQLADVNIICFSMSGGSGSVIGPILAQTIAKLDKRVVLIGVVDDHSRGACMNSIGTLKTLDAHARENKLYYPIMMYSNINAGIFAVNKTAAKRATTLIEMLTSPTTEHMDYSDRMNFLNPYKVGHAPTGIYTLGICRAKTEALGSSEGSLAGEPKLVIGSKDKAHASITVDNEGMPIHRFSNTTFVGYSEEETYYAIVGRPLDPATITALRETAILHNKTSNIPESDMDGEFEDIDSSTTSIVL